jgi:hypothetical protein
MKTLTVNLSEKEFLKYGFRSENLDFDELVRKIKIDLAKEAMKNTVSIAEKEGLSAITLEEINQEIKAVRSAKDNH